MIGGWRQRRHGPRLAMLARVRHLVPSASLVVLLAVEGAAVSAPGGAGPDGSAPVFAGARDGAQTAPWRLRLELPWSGVTYVRRGPRPTSPANLTADSQETALLGLSLSYRWRHQWEVEGGAWIGGGIRPQAALRAGRAFTLIDRRNLDGVGSVLGAEALAGLAYRGRIYDWVHTSAFQGQSALSLSAQVALEYTYFTSPSWGWNARARSGASYALLRRGPATWTDGEGPTQLEDVRSSVDLGIDLGIAF